MVTTKAVDINRVSTKEMETDITASVQGKVKKITANVGDSVQKGQVLVEFE